MTPIELTEFSRIVDFPDDNEAINRCLEAGWRVLAIKKKRIGTDPSEPDFNDHLTYVMGYSERLAGEAERLNQEELDREEELEEAEERGAASERAKIAAEEKKTGNAPVGTKLDEDVPF